MSQTRFLADVFGIEQPSLAWAEYGVWTLRDRGGLDLAMLSFLMLCFAMLAAILGRRNQILSTVAILLAGSSLHGVDRGSPATGLHVAAYVVFGVTWVAAFSGEIGRQHRAFSVAASGLMASFGLLALAMWAEVGALVLVALGLVIVMFVSAVILGLRGNAQAESPRPSARYLR